MSIVPASVKCDECGKSRREDSNHWRTLRIGLEQLTILEGLSTDDGVDGSGDRHACGDACSSKLFSRWLSTGRLEE